MYFKLVFYPIIGLIVFGSIYQLIITIIEEKNHQAPGRMVDIGGYALHINENGKKTDKPTIVLDMGIGGNHLYWHKVEKKIAHFAHVVSFDRAGIGWSEKSPFSRSSYNIVEETRKLLKAAGLKGPFILVGHSFGGLNARIYAKKYPKEVAGIILVDSSHEDQGKDLPRPKYLMNQILDKTYLHPYISALSRIGALRLYRYFKPDNENFDPEIFKISKAKESSNKFIDTLLEEWRMFDKNLEYAGRFETHFGNLPLTVITAAMEVSAETCAMHGHYSMDRCRKAYKVWHDLQKNLAARSNNAKQIMAKNSAHIVHLYEPELIVHAIRDMLENLARK